MPFFCRIFTSFLDLKSENAKTRRHDKYVLRRVFVFLHCCILRQESENTTWRKSATRKLIILTKQKKFLLT